MNGTRPWFNNSGKAIPELTDIFHPEREPTHVCYLPPIELWIQNECIMILSQDTPKRFGCFAYPLSILGGFIVVTLFAAAIGMSASNSVLAGSFGAIVGLLVAMKIMGNAKMSKWQQNN